MGVFYGLSAAIGWGVGDFFITCLTRRVGTQRAVAYTQVLSLLTWAALFVAAGRNSGSGSGDARFWLLALVAGLCHVAGIVLTYRAFEIGTLSLVSPIASGFAVVTALLALASGERPTPGALTGALLLFAGVVLATRTPPAAAAPDEETARSLPRLAGVGHALGSALAFGVMFWLFDSITPALGVTTPLVILKTLASLAALIGLRRSSEQAPAPGAGGVASAWPLALGVAAVDTLAWIAFVLGTRTQHTTIVTALASLFSVVTVLLAWGFLRERLAPNQWAGVGVILLGVLLVSF